MSMHSNSEASFERINKSVPETRDKEPDENKSKKRCIIIVLLVCVLAAAITALILVLVFKGGSNIPKGYNGYTTMEQNNGMWFFEAQLRRTKDVKLPVEVNNDTNPEFTDLSMRVSMMNDHTFRLRINPIKSNDGSLGAVEEIRRWEVPDDLLGNIKDDFGMRLEWADFSFAESPAGMELTDPRTGGRLISTKNRNFVFTDKYLELGFLVDSRHIYGFGERQREFELEEGEYTSWANGRDNHVDKGDKGGHSYGDHPFVLIKLNKGGFVGIFFKNSNAKTLELEHVGKDQSILNFKAIGGILDFFTFTGEEAEDVIRAYHQVVGVPALVPFWSLGFHQSSWQYKSQDMVSDVLKNYDKNGFPLEGMWLDIEYMDQYRNFLVSKDRFPSIPTLAQSLHQKEQRLITILDAGFAATDDYTYYKSANEKEYFIKSQQNPSKFDGNLIGSVWPGLSAFLDFYNPDVTEFWENGLRGLHTLTQTDAIWIDMNEVTTFCDGECPDGMPTTVSSTIDINSLPFQPTGSVSIIDHSISVDGLHMAKNEEEKALNIEYNMHSLYGIMQARATNEMWKKDQPLDNKRPFVLSRSTFAGSGKYTAHWLGDNWSTWEFMRLSISGIMSFNMYGTPMVGADVCGFHKPYDDEMCGRWMQLSAFYPFARNHYNLTNEGIEPLPPQEPYLLKEPFKTMARKAIIQRYCYLRYFYTRLFEITNQGGGTLVRPLFFEFPEDNNAYEDYEDTFMVGSALKITPVLEAQKDHHGKVDSYFPANSRFISLNDWTTIIEKEGTGKTEELTVSDDYTIVHMKDGSIIPFQNNTLEGYNYANRTNELIRDRGLSLIVFADKNGNAEGSLYIDQDGDNQKHLDQHQYEYYNFRFGNNSLSINLLGGSGVSTKGKFQTKNHQIDEIVLLGMGSAASTTWRACSFDSQLVPIDITATYDESIKGIRITSDKDPLMVNDLSAIQISDSSNDQSFCSPEYTIKAVTKVYNNENSLQASSLVVDIESAQPSVLPNLRATFKLVNDDILNIEIVDPLDTKAYRGPDETFASNFSMSDSEPTIDISSVLKLPETGGPFYYEVHEFENEANVYYSTKGLSFLYSKFYKKHSATLDTSGKIFGLGERVGSFFLGNGVYTLWNRDEPSPVEKGRRPGNNIYGTHPVYFAQTSGNKDFFYGVFDHNVGAQDYIIQNVDKTHTRMTQIKTSGITNQFIILRTGIQQVINNFQAIIGKPAMVPEWGLGWHQCRYGYNNTQDVADVVNNFTTNGIPLDVMWTDIDYMNMYKDFSLSDTAFKGLDDKIHEWRTQHNIRYIPILDAAVAYEPGSKGTSYARGSSKGVFIKDPNNKSKPFIGKVWPGSAVYIDWLHEEAEDYWVDEMKRLHKNLPFDGMWIDMNEASNFCDGYCFRDQRVANSIVHQLFYTPGSRSLNVKSISIDALHTTDNTEFEVHSTYGFYMSKATSKWFSDEKKRQFVITRSTYAGVGKYASHWLGDNFSTDEMLKYSVGGIYLFGMFGVPVAGADICGFIGDTNKDLCARWYAVGAFYPFSRNHNDKNSIPQEPFVPMFSENIIHGIAGYTYMDFIIETALKRYALHRYHYSYTHRASTDGTPYFTPVFYRYPAEDGAYDNVEQNIMLGEYVKLSPQFEEGLTQDFYFPDSSATWCPIWPKYQTACISGGAYVKKVLLPVDEVFVHIKSGSIIPLQLGDLKNVPKDVNIEKLKGIPLDLAVHIGSTNLADGWLRMDDGETLDLDKYTQFKFNATGFIPRIFGASTIDIDFTVEKDDMEGDVTNNQYLGSIVIYNASRYSLKSTSSAVITVDGGPVQTTAKCDSSTNICRFLVKDPAGIPMRKISRVHIESR